MQESNNYIQEYTDYVKAHCSVPLELEYSEMNKYIVIRPQNRADIVKLLVFLRDDRRSMFCELTDLFGADFPDREQRFEVNYLLLSLKFNSRILIKLSVKEDEFVPSVTGVYSAAGWFEREVWDMYGVVFENNPDLRRILTDYGFDGHPLRKDFPTTGFVEVRYDDEKKRVVYEKVKLDQEFRNFDFESPWEGPHYVLPGDEKATKNS